MFRTFLMAALLLAGGVVAARYVDQSAHTPAAAMTIETPSPVNSRSIEIKAGNGGNFEVEARVDGRRLDFVVDTGASQITLRESDAARLGIHPAQRDYSIRIGTANGEGRAALVQLGMVEVGNIVVRDIPALVARDDALSVNLLGMSFLSRMRWTHEHGKLTLEQ